MKHRVPLLAVICSISLIAAFIGHAQTKPVNSADTNYSETKTSIIVEAKHPEFVIKLISNPTTGYSWFLREYNSKLIIPISHHYESSNNSVAGAPGFETWTFRMKSDAFTVPLQTQIRLVYSRPWNTMENPKQIVFRISTVKKY